MKIVFIRHGEPDYAPCEERGFIGQGRDLAPLTRAGMEQAENVSKNELLDGCEIIIASPYTRALQTAAIISRNTGIKIEIEVDLREWCSDKTYQNRTEEQKSALYQDFVDCKGMYPKGETRDWETIEEIIDRVVPVLNKYLELGFDKIMIVAHGGIIRRFVGEHDIKYCTPYEIDYDREYPRIGWVD